MDAGKKAAIEALETQFSEIGKLITEKEAEVNDLIDEQKAVRRVLNRLYAGRATVEPETTTSKPLAVRTPPTSLLETGGTFAPKHFIEALFIQQPDRQWHPKELIVELRNAIASGMVVSTSPHVVNAAHAALRRLRREEKIDEEGEPRKHWYRLKAK